MAKALVGNAADPEQVKEADSKAKRGRERELDDVHFILRHPEGRRFVWRYLEECGVYKTSFTESNKHTFFLEGIRNVGLKLLTDINEASPESLLLMMKEAKGDKDV